MIFTGLVAGYLLILVLGFVVPPFGRVFADMKIALPWITGALVTASEAFVPFRGACWAAPPWILGLLTLCGVPAGGSPLLAAALLRYPWIGRVLRHAAASQITLGISRLLGSGRSLPDALSCLREATRSTFLREKMDQVLGDVLRGEPLAHALGRTGLLDPVSTGFIAEGEERGYLAQMLEGVSIEEARRVGRSLLVIRIAVGAAPFLIGAMILGSWMALWQPLLGLFHG
ncbi:MAG: type II secretion system F family protein [Planctomycetes bacterium]|nr:type II secretion system F family protein [Planctomycetota bacterium]